MSEHRIAYAPRNDVSPESEIGVLSAVYSFVIKSHQTSRNTEEVSDVDRSNRSPVVKDCSQVVQAIHGPQKGKHGTNG